MDNSTKKRKIIIADDHISVREWLEVILNENPLLQVVETLSCGTNLESAVTNHKPDLVITDIKMPGLTGDAFGAAIRKRYPELPLIAYTGFHTDSLFIGLLRIGFNGIVSKSSPMDELIMAVEMVLNGYVGYCKSTQLQINSLIEKHYYNPRRNTVKSLINEHHLQIIKLIAEGNTSSEIADKLGVGVQSVNTHRKRLLDKTGCINPANLIHYANREGLIDDVEP